MSYDKRLISKGGTKMDLVNVDPHACVFAFKEDNGKYYIVYATENHKTSRMEISKEFYDAVVEEFGDKNWNK